MGDVDETVTETENEFKAILNEVYSTIDDDLSLNDIGKSPHLQHKRSWQRVCHASFPPVDWSSIVRSLAARIESNWDRSPSRGKENWRSTPQLEMSDQNTGEKKLEKRIAEFCEGWVNQVPTCSGINPGHNGKRSVDLAHLHEPTLELIELKINSDNSDTPLWAAFEILIYGLLYRFSRAHREQLGYRLASNPLLFNYSDVQLKVLAPSAYYPVQDRRALEALENGINMGLAALPMDGYSMIFAFESFTQGGIDEEFSRLVCEAIIAGRMPVVGS